MIVEEISVVEADAALKDGHYLGEIGYHPTVILAERNDAGAVHALAVFAPPTPQHFKKKLPGCLELTRLWQSEDRRERRLEYGPLSLFVKSTMQWLREHKPDVPCIFSYTDPGHEHNGVPNHGAVYHAARFKCFGPSRVTDEWYDPKDPHTKISSPVCYRRYHTKSRLFLRSTGLYECVAKDCKTQHQHVGPGLVLIHKPPKILFVFGLAKTWRDVRNIIGGRYAADD